MTDLHDKEKGKKKRFEDDLIDAFWCGYNYRDNILYSSLRKALNEPYEGFIPTKNAELCIKKMLKDKLKDL